MRHLALQTLTWGTVMTAVTSALWLASVEPGWPDLHKSPRHDGVAPMALPKEPTSAGHLPARRVEGGVQPSEPARR